MNNVQDLRSQAEVPLWIEPLAQSIALKIKGDLAENTAALVKVQAQMADLIELQLTFLESMKSRSVK